MEKKNIQNDYIKSGFSMPPYLAYPRFLLKMNLRPITKIVYSILLEMMEASEVNGWVDKDGRLYLEVPLNSIANVIDRTEPTVRNALKELEDVGLIERQLVKRSQPDRTYILTPKACCPISLG